MAGTFEPAGDMEDVVRDAVADQVRAAADDIAGNAEANITFPGGRTGPVEVSDTDRGAQVGLMGPFAHIEEWGSVNNAPFAPLRRAVEASGLEFDEQ